ncbi:1-acyl-sn-glycerol-3-phosphate acyltransferase [Parashewanella curva]|uniref:1-acyl-sn-glycerol-3-phosphate acyltransferase n=1 Tax=Parashewanella curva TaxID=2338552 RepID=A0A3L8PZE2_9GAMM|nr:lysophospholipid acyltransferase family protein [Parashewanella curva]RLV60520.1 1-acyl-sn-glycerol-3-phosphate acyltransferase [Parashewanella curva]
MVLQRVYTNQVNPAPKLTGLSYIPRWVGGILCYVFFGLGGLLLSLTALPLLRLWPGKQDVKIARVQKTVQFTFKFFVSMMQWAGVINVDAKAALLLSNTKGKVIVANHPTLVDVVILISLIPNAGCIVKRELWRNPFLRGVVSMAGYIPNNGADALMYDSKKVLERGNNLVIFPEGTRTKLGESLNPFARGAANIAIRTESDVLAILLNFDVRGLTKQNPWYEIPRQTINMTVDIGKMFSYQKYDSEHKQDAKQVRNLTRDMENYYKKKLK